MVVSNRRVLVVQFAKPFPAKKDGPLAPASMIANRVRLVDEQIWFPQSFNDIDTVRSQTANTQVNEWLFHPATLGTTFDPPA